MLLTLRAGSRRERDVGRYRRSVPESASWDSELPNTAPLQSARACRQPCRARRRAEKTPFRWPVWCGSCGPPVGAGPLAEPAADRRPRRRKGSGPPALPPRLPAAVRLAALEVLLAAPPAPFPGRRALVGVWVGCLESGRGGRSSPRRKHLAAAPERGFGAAPGAQRWRR